MSCRCSYELYCSLYVVCPQWDLTCCLTNVCLLDFNIIDAMVNLNLSSCDWFFHLQPQVLHHEAIPLVDKHIPLPDKLQNWLSRLTLCVRQVSISCWWTIHFSYDAKRNIDGQMISIIASSSFFLKCSFMTARQGSSVTEFFLRWRLLIVTYEIFLLPYIGDRIINSRLSNF